jgi:hypothetical protein
MLPTDHEMILTMNAIDAHAQNSVAVDDLLLPVQKEFSQYTR